MSGPARQDGRREQAMSASPAYCSWCGTQAPDGAPPTWSMQTSERGVQLLCEDCTRANLRSIEAKLDGEWW